MINFNQGKWKKRIIILLCLFCSAGFLMADYSSGSCSGGFKVNFRNAEFVTGIGWQKGTDRTINFSGSCSGCFWGPGVYGWMTNPLIEYYIGKKGGSSKGSYKCNGNTYNLQIYRQRGKPSIVGTADFDQYNCSGTRNSPVDMGCHLKAWKKLGANVGTHDYQVVMAEGFGGSTGQAQATVEGANWYTHWTNGGSVSYTCSGSSATPQPTAKPTEKPNNNKGDVNNDGKVTIVDALLIAQYYVKQNPSGFNQNNADTNCDSRIDIVDALLAAKYYVGQLNRFC